MCKERRLIFEHKGIICAVANALQEEDTILLCHIGDEAKMRARVDQVLGPVPWPNKLTLMEVEETKED